MINIVLDATMLNTFQSCEFKYYVRFELDKGPLLKPEPLDRGDLIHIGKEYYYKCIKETRNWNLAVQTMEDAIRERIKTESQLPYEDADRMIAVCKENVNHWRTWDLSIEIVAVEKPFSYVLYEDDTFRIVMIGKIDLLFTDNTYENCPMDTKSFTRDFELRRWDNQFMNYAIATDSNYLFVDRVGLQGMEGEVKNPLPLTKRHKRVPLSFDPLIKKQWVNNTVAWCMRYWDCSVNNSWPLNLTSCDKFNRKCEYLDDICNTSGEDNKIYKLEHNFKTLEKWDVAKSLGLKK